jgi:hypothetical protein
LTVSEHQLALDLDALRSLVDGLQDRRRVQVGAERLLVALVRAGLDEEALIPAAALALELDQPNNHHQEDG